MTTTITTPVAKFSEEDIKAITQVFSDVATEGREADREMYFLTEATAVYNALRATGLQIPPLNPQDDVFEETAGEVSAHLVDGLVEKYSDLLRTFRFDQDGKSNYLVAEELLTKRHQWFSDNEVYLDGARVFGIERRILQVANDPFMTLGYGEHIYVFTMRGSAEVKWDTVFVINPHQD